MLNESLCSLRQKRQNGTYNYTLERAQ